MVHQEFILLVPKTNSGVTVIRLANKYPCPFSNGNTDSESYFASQIFISINSEFPHTPFFTNNSIFIFLLSLFYPSATCLNKHRTCSQDTITTLFSIFVFIIIKMKFGRWAPLYLCLNSTCTSSGFAYTPTKPTRAASTEPA